MYTKGRPIYRLEAPRGARPLRRGWPVALAIAGLVVLTLLGASLGRGATLRISAEDEAAAGESTVDVADIRRGIMAALTTGAAAPPLVPTRRRAPTGGAGPDGPVAESDLPPRFAPGFARPTPTVGLGEAPVRSPSPRAPAFVGPIFQTLLPSAPRFRRLPALPPTPVPPPDPGPPSS